VATSAIKAYLRLINELVVNIADGAHLVQ